ncbi:MAG: fibronectin type III-like domain-contianing protein, partial [Verrucomicrobiota bacterium]
AAGEEVVQLYVKDVQPDTDLRIRMLSAFASEQLRGFQRVELKPGQRKTVQIPLPAKWLEHWDMTRHAFVLEPGRIELRVGASSADIRLTKTIAVGN